MRMFPDAGFNFVHVEDVADGIVLAHDKGRIGESYNLAGNKGTLGELMEKTAEYVGREPPRVTMPPAMMKLAIPIGPVVGKLMGFPPNLAELIKTSDGVTFWMTDEKARRELGYTPRDFDTAMRQTVQRRVGHAGPRAGGHGLGRHACRRVSSKASAMLCAAAPTCSRRTRTGRPPAARPGVGGHRIWTSDA